MQAYELPSLRGTKQSYNGGAMCQRSPRGACPERI